MKKYEIIKNGNKIKVIDNEFKEICKGEIDENGNISAKTLFDERMIFKALNEENKEIERTRVENKILNKKEIINFKCEDTSKEFESVMGIIWYQKNWGWRVELKEPIGCIVRKDLSDMIKELKAEEEGCSVDDIYFINGVATVIKKEETVKQDKKSDIEVEVELNNKSKKEKSDYIDFEYRCWECGCILDEKGNCEVCGCSKEIFEI